MNLSGAVNKILYGGDYNPEQWPHEIWKEDMRLFKLAGIDVVSINIFSWAALQQSEDEYNFSTLDEIVETVKNAGIKICFGTSTATHPAWMARKYPEILRVNSDGSKRKFGDRHNSCPNSSVYRLYAGALAGKLAERYGKLDNIAAWHVSNEFGGHCYCEKCEKAFRQWLKNKYKTIEALNETWYSAFWGHTYYDWDDIVPPSKIGGGGCNIQSIDYNRFMSDSLLECYLVEADILHKITPNIPVTTNMMGTFFELDYFKWGKHVDFMAWDSYPWPDHPYTRTSMNHALMRGCGNGKPFSLMESSPGVVNWQSYDTLKRPGVVRLLSFQAIAHGSDTVMYFQLRRSRGSCEKFHGAVIDHCGHENTRVFKDVSQIGEELQKLGNTIIDSKVVSQAAVLFDWDNWWGVTYSAGPSIDKNYVEEIYHYYSSFAKQNFSVDIIGVDTPLDNYKILAAPFLYMVKPGFAEKLETFVKNGGIFITTYFSGMTDENDLVTLNGYPGELRKLCGLWVEETDALPLNRHNGFVIKDGPLVGTYKGNFLYNIIRLDSAQAVAVYESDFYAGTPVLCKNNYGKGQVWYFGSRPETTLLDKFSKLIMDECKIEHIFPAQEGIEAVKREKDGREFIFVLNHNKKDTEIIIPYACRDLLTGRTFASSERYTLPETGVLILSN